MSSAQNLSFVWDFSTQCICMGTGSLFVHSFRGKAHPLQRSTVFAVDQLRDVVTLCHLHEVYVAIAGVARD